MVAVATGDVSPIQTGITYCAVIDACMTAFDMRRAAEWTAALDQWCGAQPDLVPYRGICLVHRSQVLQAHGAWSEAVADAERARLRLAETAHPALGVAYYQQGELHRLCGAFAEAERAYRAAHQHGREPAPGLALLRLAEGKLETAVAAIHRMVDEYRGQPHFPTMLAASVEIMLAAQHAEAARADAAELAGIAAAMDMPHLRAIADFATGSVLVADGDARAGLAVVPPRAPHGERWRCPTKTARAQVEIGLGCRAIGDYDAADFELAAARATFERLGARPESTRARWFVGAHGPGVDKVDRT